MRCGGSGKIYKIDYTNTRRRVDCPGCKDCQCTDCGGHGLYVDKDGNMYPNEHGTDPEPCPTCHGTGRKVSDER